MKLLINTQDKTIKVVNLDEIELSELFNELESTLVDWHKYRIILNDHEQIPPARESVTDSENVLGSIYTLSNKNIDIAYTPNKTLKITKDGEED